MILACNIFFKRFLENYKIFECSSRWNKGGFFFFFGGNI